MDTFFEQIVVRRRTPVEWVFRVLLIIMTVALPLLLVLFTLFWNTMLKPVFLLAAFGVAFAGYYALTMTNVEYEYSVTNEYFDIDKIIGKRKRRRMISTTCGDIEVFGDYNKQRAALKSQQFDAKIFAANLGEDGLYYAILHHKKRGRVLLVIQPDDRIQGALKRFLPKQVAIDAFGWDGLH